MDDAVAVKRGTTFVDNTDKVLLLTALDSEDDVGEMADAAASMDFRKRRSEG